MKALTLALLLTTGSLAACNGTLNPAQTIEKAQITVEDAYVAVATAANAYEAANPAGTAGAEAIKVQAWNILVKANAAAKIGQDVTPYITQLQGLLAQVKGL